MNKSFSPYMPHPWHGIEVGPNAPELVNSFIEMTPHDTVKYEIDKVTGFLKIDRPQKYSNIIPALYGFIPKTYCGKKVAARCMEKTGRKEIVGDHDPLDICVLTERNITHGNILMTVRPIGGFRMIDRGEADDKIVAILNVDEVYDPWKTIEDVPENLVHRLKHYFLTYKQMPYMEAKCEIVETYGREEALELIRRSMQDYDEEIDKNE
ncbi:MAG: inorganic pyrophosphatase [Candidatus Cyclobacteriaceae bacterium M2_1C_046]